jgi:RNA polymerase sigma-B factor
MWGEIERSPVLAAPSFNDCVGLTATSTNLIVGEEDENPQAANDLCEKYLPLARKIAAGFTGRGIHYEDLYLAGRLGLVRASRKFDPDRGAFGPYAKLWIKGEITRLFKPAADAMALGRSESLNAPALGDDQAADLPLQADETVPAVTPDLSGLTEREQAVLVGRSRGETLSELGRDLGVSQERVRQVHAKATQKARKIKGNVALACIRDLTKRRGYRKERREVLPYKPRSSAGHTYTCDEVEHLVASRPDLLQTATEDERSQRWWIDQRLIWAERAAGVRR